MRLRTPVALVVAAIAGPWLCGHISAGSDEPVGLFERDLRHVSNRLYRQVHVRLERDGKEHGYDSLDPLLWRETGYLLSGKSHQEAVTLAAEFLRTHAERQISEVEKRAILQRDIWAIFDWADEQDPGEPSHKEERRELMLGFAAIVKRLALSPEELRQLPDTYALAVRNHEFPAAYDEAYPNRAFLPPDLLDPGGPWVCLGAPNHELAAPLHDLSFTARSVFFVFARLPGGRGATLAYFNQLAEMKIPLFVRMQEPGWPQAVDVWNPEVPQFPAGTEFALVRKLLLPDRAGHLEATPVTESVQIRHYTEISKVNPMASRDVALAKRFQEPSAIELSRELFFAKGHSGLRGVTASDDPLLIFPAMSNGIDIFEDGREPVSAVSPFVLCTSCHLGPGIQSMMSFSFRANPNETPVFSPRLGETTPSEETKKVLQWAQTQQKWKDLFLLWNSSR